MRVKLDFSYTYHWNNTVQNTQHYSDTPPMSHLFLYFSEVRYLTLKNSKKYR